MDSLCLHPCDLINYVLGYYGRPACIIQFIRDSLNIYE